MVVNMLMNRYLERIYFCLVSQLLNQFRSIDGSIKYGENFSILQLKSKLCSCGFTAYWILTILCSCELKKDLILLMFLWLLKTVVFVVLTVHTLVSVSLHPKILYLNVEVHASSLCFCYRSEHL